MFVWAGFATVWVRRRRSEPGAPEALVSGAEGPSKARQRRGLPPPQEMRRDPGADLELAEVLAQCRHRLGPGRYETLFWLGELDRFPVLTFSHDGATPPPNAPAEAYLRMIGGGLAESHGLTAGQCADYLVGCPGIGRDRTELVQLLAGGSGSVGADLLL